jgi:hypothetical protein
MGYRQGIPHAVGTAGIATSLYETRWLCDCLNKKGCTKHHTHIHARARSQCQDCCGTHPRCLHIKKNYTK